MIEVEDLRVHRGGDPVLEIDHLLVDRELVAVMGPNGAGKTTLLETLAGRLPYEGHVSTGPVWFTGTDPPAPTLVRADELVSGHGARDPQAWLAKVGYDGPESLAHGSSGERMLVALAGALSRQGADLLLDEPFGHLDPPHVARLIPLLAERSGTDSVCFVTHDPTAAAHADRVLLLDRSIVAAGPPEEVLQAAPLSECYGAPIEVEWTRLGPVVQGQAEPGR